MIKELLIKKAIKMKFNPDKKIKDMTFFEKILFVSFYRSFTKRKVEINLWKEFYKDKYKEILKSFIKMKGEIK